MPNSRRRSLTFLKAGIVAAVAASIPLASAHACEPADPFEGADAVVVGKIISVRQTAWRVLFWGTNAWRAEVVTTRRLHGKAPARFSYQATAFTGDCVSPDPRPRSGQVLVFPLRKVDARYIGEDGQSHEKPNWKGHYASYYAMPEPLWRKHYGDIYPSP